LVEVAGLIGGPGPVDRAGGIDGEHGGGEPVGTRQPFRRDTDELLEPVRQVGAADTGRRGQVTESQGAGLGLVLVCRTSPSPGAADSRRTSSCSSSTSISCGVSAVASRSRSSVVAARPHTCSRVTGRSRSSVAGTGRKGARPQGLTCTPTDRVWGG